VIEKLYLRARALHTFGRFQRPRKVPEVMGIRKKGPSRVRLVRHFYLLVNRLLWLPDH
jgi:hypothetical protein